MELRHLRYAVAVADHLNFRQAAEHLNISQPPLSQQIQDLEAELGCEIFVRNRREVRLTPAGQLFVERAREMLSLSQSMIESTRQVANGERGQLSLGFVGSTVFSLLPKIIKRFRRAHPSIELKLSELSTMQQLEALRKNQLDIAMVRSPPQESGLKHAIVIEDDLIVAVSQQHTLAKRDSISLRECASENFVTFPRQSSPELYDQITASCHRAGFSPKFVQEAEEMTTIVGLVAADIGIALIPGSVGKFRIEGVKYLRPVDRLRPVNFTFCTRVKESSPLVADFLKCARESL